MASDLQAGRERKRNDDQAEELFAGKHKKSVLPQVTALSAGSSCTNPSCVLQFVKAKHRSSRRNTMIALKEYHTMMRPTARCFGWRRIMSISMTTYLAFFGCSSYLQ